MSNKKDEKGIFFRVTEKQAEIIRRAAMARYGTKQGFLQKFLREATFKLVKATVEEAKKKKRGEASDKASDGD